MGNFHDIPETGRAGYYNWHHLLVQEIRHKRPWTLVHVTQEVVPDLRGGCGEYYVEHVYYVQLVLW